jgi:hypothetical protein
MKTDMPIEGWMPAAITRPRGGSAATEASNRKDAAAERLADLVGGSGTLRGVENRDDLKAGDLTPEARIRHLLDGIALYSRRLASLETDANVAPYARPRIRQDLEGRRGRLAAQLLGIWRDLPPGVGGAELAVRVAALRGIVKELKAPSAPAPEAKATKAVVSDARCPKCNRLLSPPKGYFGCMCGAKSPAK